jgi:hypothetical protein
VSNRSQTPTVLSQRSLGNARQAEARDVADAVTAHVDPVAVVDTQLGVDGRVARGPAQRTAARSLAPRRNANASTASTAHAAQSGSTSSFSNTHLL